MVIHRLKQFMYTRHRGGLTYETLRNLEQNRPYHHAGR